MTLARDRTLRVWPISDQLSSSLGAVPMDTESSHEEVASIEASLSSQMEAEITFTEVLSAMPLTQYFINTFMVYSCVSAVRAIKLEMALSLGPIISLFMNMYVCDMLDTLYFWY